MVDRPGWSPGSAISFILSGRGARVGVSYDGHAEQAPKLLIQYKPEQVQEDFFEAYNDLSWLPGQLEENITLYTTDTGDGLPPEGSSGRLLDYRTGLVTPVTLRVEGGLWDGAAHATKGMAPKVATDAHDVFNTKVDTVGVINYAQQDVVLSFSGLNPAHRYELVIYGDRGNDRYTDRISSTMLLGAEAFVNASTPGSGFGGAHDNTTLITQWVQPQQRVRGSIHSH